ncbi:hypothetical protein GCM10025771_21810 [Niveibacterium umoris]|uniref:DUF4124 domain-containing protein n=1 Tax=Niveibacterium umoris TaxID=1193620 RepID=A0A840BM71_9RHOO|nr:DUF4124 domain-containing protein [Niveibacterium umoris]MBB4012629.1 hypothetical protein [Niveibacterium umoris]
MSRLLIAILCCAAALPALAGVYKWVDANGKVHYSDQPPPSADASSVSITRPSGVTAPETSVNPKGDTKAAKAKEDEARERERKKVCDDLRAEQVKLENSPSGNALKTGDERALRAKMIEQNQIALKYYGC